MAFTKIAAAGIGSTGTVTLQNLTVTGNLNASASGLTGLTKTLTIGVRVGAAVTFNITGSSFNVSARSGNVSINV